MTALSSDANIRVLGEAYTEAFLLDSSGAQTIYKGVPMVIDQSVDALNVHGADGLTLVDGDVFMGIAAEGKAIASGAAETTEVECYVGPTILGFKSSVFTMADCGKAVYMSDSNTLTATNGTYPRIGKLFKVADGYAFVTLDSPYVIDVP